MKIKFILKNVIAIIALTLITTFSSFADMVEQNVIFNNGQLKFGGTLALPDTVNQYPALVLVTGSGLQNRDEEIFGFKIFKQISDYLVQQGYAVFRYDDRGIGESKNEHISSDSITMFDYANDAYSAFTTLKSHKNIDKNNSKLIIPKSQKETNSKSGLLLGLKCIDELGLGCNYRTLWISSSYGKIMPIVNIKDLVVPRKSGFWKVGVKKVWEKGVKKDIVWSEILGNNKTSTIKYRNISGCSSEILFVGEEYISMDDRKVYNDDDGDQRFESGDFSVLPLDNFNGNKMDFSKAFGDDAGSRLKYSADLYLKKMNLSKNKIDENKLQTNWSVDRRSGRWMLRGRIPYGDFDVMYAAPTILTDYDDLYPSFDVIKKEIPDAVDAYTSPNRDFIVVLTETKLKIYSLNNKKIGKLDREFDLKNGETAVMSQWLLGSYVDKWNKLIKNMKKN